MLVGISKLVLGTASAMGAQLVVSNAIKATTPENISKIGKALVFTGSLVISSIVSTKAQNYVVEQIDIVHAIFTKTEKSPE